MQNRELESSALDRPRVRKVWGYEDIIHNADDYCGKLLHLTPNFQCSLHFHCNKHETFTAIEGNVWVEYYPSAKLDFDPDPTVPTIVSVVEIGNPTITLLRGWAYDSLKLPPFTAHRFWTTDPDGATLAEFSTPHSDDDVVRLCESRPLPPA